MAKKYFEYYPNRIAKDNKFEKHLKNEKKFQVFCRGKEVPFYKDEGNWGTKLDMGNVSEKESIKRAFVLQEFYGWKSWKEKGRNIFNFSSILIELLKETDILDIDISLIKLPYSNYFIDLSSAKIPFEKEGTEYIEGVYISEEIGNGIDFERVITLDFVGDYIDKYWYINIDLDWDFDRGFHSYSLFLDKKDNLKTIKDAVTFDKDGFVGSAMVDDRDDDTKIDLYLIHSQFVDRTINLIINCLLYLTTKDKDIEEKYPDDLPIHLKANLEKANTKRKKEIANNEIINFGFTRIKYVGNNLKRNRKNENSLGETSIHWRRGHWRNQKFGKDLNENKLIWIMPTLVNKSKDGGIKGRIYDVE